MVVLTRSQAKKQQVASSMLTPSPSPSPSPSPPSLPLWSLEMGMIQSFIDQERRGYSDDQLSALVVMRIEDINDHIGQTHNPHNDAIYHIFHIHKSPLEGLERNEIENISPHTSTIQVFCLFHGDSPHYRQVAPLSAFLENAFTHYSRTQLLPNFPLSPLYVISRDIVDNLLAHFVRVFSSHSVSLFYRRLWMSDVSHRIMLIENIAEKYRAKLRDAQAKVRATGLEPATSGS